MAESAKRHGPPSVGDMTTNPDGSGSVDVSAPPPGERYWYEAAIVHTGEDWSVTFDVGLPDQVNEIAVETSILVRKGGPTPEDIAYRERLFRMVGEATVAGGRIEAGMKRLLLILEPRAGGFATVDDMWAELDRKLRAAAQRAADRPVGSAFAAGITRALDAAADDRLREIRNHLVHGYHWTFEVGRVVVSRFERRQDVSKVSETEEALGGAVGRLTAFADELERLATPRWHVAVLHRPTDV